MGLLMIIFFVSVVILMVVPEQNQHKDQHIREINDVERTTYVVKTAPWNQ